MTSSSNLRVARREDDTMPKPDRIECPLCEARRSRQPCDLCGPGEGSLPRSRLLRLVRLGLNAYNRGPARHRAISSGRSQRPKVPA
jgi:hypothetical protein